MLHCAAELADFNVVPDFEGPVKNIEKKQNISARIVWAAKAIAIPPIPRPAISEFILTPRLSRKRNRAAIQTAAFIIKDRNLSGFIVSAPVLLFQYLPKKKTSSEEANMAPVIAIRARNMVFTIAAAGRTSSFVLRNKTSKYAAGTSRFFKIPMTASSTVDFVFSALFLSYSPEGSG